jgi:hypothetical protein
LSGTCLSSQALAVTSRRFLSVPADARKAVSKLAGALRVELDKLVHAAD